MNVNPYLIERLGFDADEMMAIDEWRKQNNISHLPPAIKQLIEIGLGASTNLNSHQRAMDKRNNQDRSAIFLAWQKTTS